MTRERLPQRRQSEVFALKTAGIDYAITLGRYPDGRLAAVFITCGKIGTSMAALARDAAVLVSLALQHGVSLDTIADALTRDEAGEAAGLAGAVVDRIRQMEGESWG